MSVVSKSLKIGIPVVIVLLAVGVVWWLASTGRIYYGAKDPDARVAIYKDVCPASLLESYRKDFVAAYPTKDTMKKYYDQIVALKDWEADPNCVYIVMQYSVLSGDVATTKKYVEKLDELSASGLTADYGVQRSGIAPSSAEESAKAFEKDEIQYGGM